MPLVIRYDLQFENLRVLGWRNRTKGKKVCQIRKNICIQNQGLTTTYKEKPARGVVCIHSMQALVEYFFDKQVVKIPEPYERNQKINSRGNCAVAITKS